MDKTILVAGGVGFIGSHLCKELIEKSHKIICVDNISTGRQSNLDQLQSNDNFKFLKGDICNKDFVKSLTEYNFVQVYHLASPASVTYITDHPIEAALANSIGTKNLLELAILRKAKMLFASSSEAYGNPKEHPQKEAYWGNVNPVGIRSGYDEGKRFGEALCMAYHREKGARVRIVRIFNTYGPNSSISDTRVIPQLITRSLKNELLTVHGDGLQTRSFCYVSDMTSGLIKMMEKEENGPINLGNPDEYKIIDVAKKIIAATGSRSKLKFVPRPQDDPAVRRPDLTLAKEKLDWYPAVPFDEGLRKTIDYFKEVLGEK